jgi:hypothetical protein
MHDIEIIEIYRREINDPLANVPPYLLRFGHAVAHAIDMENHFAVPVRVKDVNENSLIKSDQEIRDEGRHPASNRMPFGKISVEIPPAPPMPPKLPTPAPDKTGGPAFGTYQQAGDMAVRDGGLTMLDYFATHIDYGPGHPKHAEALVGRKYPSILDDKPISDSDLSMEILAFDCDLEAKTRYLKAAAMLRAREEAMK